MQELETVLESKQRLDNNREVNSLETDAE